MTRRTWLAGTAALLERRPLRGNAAGAAPVGAELYTVRDLLREDPKGTLRALAGIGFREVEGDRAALIELKPLLGRHGLTTPSCMIETPLVTGRWDLWQAADTSLKRVEWDKALEGIRSLGVRYAVWGYPLPAERGDNPDSYKRLAGLVNSAGERCAKAGIRLCYHNHATEFAGRLGERLIDVLIERLDPALVMFEVDVFWASIAGEDPAAFIDRLTGRLALVHLKDRRIGSRIRKDEDAPPEDFVDIGTGCVDFRAVMNAAAAAGVRQYYIEQDYTPGDPLASLRRGYEYLRGLR